jgi:hypothetical protein
MTSLNSLPTLATDFNEYHLLVKKIGKFHAFEILLKTYSDILEYKHCTWLAERGSEILE